MAPARKAKRAGKKRAATRKPTRKTTKKGAKRAAKGARKPAARRAGKKPAARRAAKAPAAAASAARPKTVALKPRKAGVFATTDLYDHVGQWNPDLGKKQVRTVVDDVLNTIQGAVKKTGKVRLKGIGTITTRKKPAQKGGKLVRNPFTGEMVKSKPKPASVRVKLSAAKELKQA